MFGKIIITISPNLNIESLSKKQLSNLYLKKIDRINGKKIVFIDTAEDHEEFCRKILNKSPSQVHAYWMKQVFLGKKIPPKKYSREQISQIIKKSPNIIGYSSKEIEGKSIYETK